MNHWSLMAGATALLASFAMAGVRLTLVPNPPPPYEGGEVVIVDVMLSQEGETNPLPNLLRFVQVDLSDTDPALVVPITGPVWDFSGLPGCAGHPAGTCPGYFFDADLGPTTFGPHTASMGYVFQDKSNLGPNPDAQIEIPSVGQVKVATLEVQLPEESGDYLLEVVNADEEDRNYGAVVIFGFGIQDDDPVRIFHSSHDDPNRLLGGRLPLIVGSEEIPLASSAPPTCSIPNGTGSSLWRSKNNSILLDFPHSVGLPEDEAIEIRELLDGGAFGPNLNTSGNFTGTVERGGMGLRIQENGSIFEHRKWYVIRNVGGWTGVSDFAVKLVVQMGDVDNDGRVLAQDVSLINACIPCFNVPCAGFCDERRDMNDDDRILAADVSIANAHIPSMNVNIPSGHTCP